MRINIDDPSAGWGTPIIIWPELVCATEQSVVSRVLNLKQGMLQKFPIQHLEQGVCWDWNPLTL